MIKVPFEFGVWYRHRGNTKYIPARVDAALKEGHQIFVRYRNGHVVNATVGAGYRWLWGHSAGEYDIMAYQIVEKK